MTGIFAYVYTTTNNFSSEKYSKGMAEFQKNEKAALHLFQMIGKSNKKEIVDFIKNQGIPSWNRNISLLNELDKTEGLTDKLKKQNKILKEYCGVRIEGYKLIEKATIENTSIYNSEIEKLNKKIDELIKKL